MSDETKQYIIAFSDEKVSQAYAADVIGAKKRHVKDGVSILGSDEAISDKDVLHFEELGTTVCSLSDIERARLEADDRVVQITEDITVYALEYTESLTEASVVENQPDTPSPLLMNAYLSGYYQGIAQHTNGNGVVDTADSFSFPQTANDAWTQFFFPFPFPIRLPSLPSLPPLPTLPIPLPLPKQQPDWNIKQVKANRVWHRVTGRGVKVAVIDTGIDNNHPDLTIAGGVSFVPSNTSWDDDHSHGTHCAGIIGARNNIQGVVGVAPDCSLYAVKVMRPTADGRASGQLSWILAGMAWAAQNGMDVASMSLGSDATSADMPFSVAYQRAAQRLVAKGCTVIAASGNSFGKARPWVGQPARCPSVMAVAAVDRNGRIAPFSSRGPATLGALNSVEISAPGVQVNSTVPGGGYGKKSGTSMACPHVAGAAALLKELHPTWTPDQIRNRLKATATDLDVNGRDIPTGMGLLDCRREVFG